MENGKYISKEITSQDDVWGVISALAKEAEDHNEGGHDFDVAESVYVQIPFFACPNLVLDQKFQNDILRYIYCEKFGTSPYIGGYGGTPKRWIEKSMIISNYISRKREKSLKKNG